MAQVDVADRRYIESAPLFFERLDHADLPKAIRAPVGGVLNIFLEDDEETVPPSEGSFSTFLSFLERHHDLPLPSIGVNRDGRFVAVWQNSAFRLSYEFLPNDEVRWASTGRKAGTIVVDHGVMSLNAVPADFSCLRGTPTPPTT